MVTILDGGMGRELWRSGAPFRQPEWSALALYDAPELVQAAHRRFVDAGADVVTTNTYAVVPFHIGDERFAADGERLSELAGRLAAAAVAESAAVSKSAAVTESAAAARVAGSLPPLFGSYRPDLFDAAAAPAVIDPLVAGLAPHVDLWLGETLGSIAEAAAVREALDRHAQTEELWLSFNLDERAPGRLISGETVAEAARAAEDLGASTLLFNCCPVEAIETALDGLDTGLAVGGYANRFVAHHDDDHAANDGLSDYRSDLDPGHYADAAARWVRLGATVIGGCCGIGPEHIAELARRLH